MTLHEKLILSAALLVLVLGAVVKGCRSSYASNPKLLQMQAAGAD